MVSELTSLGMPLSVQTGAVGVSERGGGLDVVLSTFKMALLGLLKVLRKCWHLRGSGGKEGFPSFLSILLLALLPMGLLP